MAFFLFWNIFLDEILRRKNFQTIIFELFAQIARRVHNFKHNLFLARQTFFNGTSEKTLFFIFRKMDSSFNGLSGK